MHTVLSTLIITTRENIFQNSGNCQQKSDMAYGIYKVKIPKALYNGHNLSEK